MNRNGTPQSVVEKWNILKDPYTFWLYISNLYGNLYKYIGSRIHALGSQNIFPCYCKTIQTTIQTLFFLLHNCDPILLHFIHLPLPLTLCFVVSPTQL